MTSDLTVPLRDQITAVARTVPLRLGDNALRLANEGMRLCLSGSEAEELADELLPVVEAYVAGRVAAALNDAADELDVRAITYRTMTGPVLAACASRVRARAASAGGAE